MRSSDNTLCQSSGIGKVGVGKNPTEKRLENTWIAPLPVWIVTVILAWTNFQRSGEASRDTGTEGSEVVRELRFGRPRPIVAEITTSRNRV
jgi:hypothetical protein